jgi:hypothetical protein
MRIANVVDKINSFPLMPSASQPDGKVRNRQAHRLDPEIRQFVIGGSLHCRTPQLAGAVA